MSSLCPICLDEENNDFITTNCDHQFCSDCLKEWLCVDNSCPICRNHKPLELLPLNKYNIDLEFGIIHDISNTMNTMTKWKKKLPYYKNQECRLQIRGDTLYIICNNLPKRCGCLPRNNVILKKNFKNIQSISTEGDKTKIIYANINKTFKKKKQLNLHEIIFTVDPKISVKAKKIFKDWFSSI